jgi:protoporphyrinogen oxidase
MEIERTTLGKQRAYDRETSVAIVGGGIMGLSIARELSSSGARNITVFEKADQLGGLSSSYRWGEAEWDRFYHVILSSDSDVLELISELGLSGRLFWKETQTGFYGQGRLVSMNGIKDFLAFPFLGLWQKLRLGVGILVSSRIGDIDKLDRIYVRQWLTHVFGRRVYEQIWDPLLRSKFGAARDRSSAALMGATIRRLYGARQGREKIEKMGHVHGGYKTILAELARQLVDRGVDLRISCPVVGAEGCEGGVELTLGDDFRKQRFDRAVLTVSGREISEIVPMEDHSYWQAVTGVEYLGVICVLVFLRRKLSPYYVINLLDKTLPFTGIIEATNVVDPTEIGDNHLVYLPKYVAPEDPMQSESDDLVTSKFIAGLQRVFPDLRDEEIVHTVVFRARDVQPLHDIGYLSKIAGYSSPIPGLFVANKSMIRHSTLNNNAVIAIARDAASQLLAPVAARETGIQEAR